MAGVEAYHYHLEKAKVWSAQVENAIERGIHETGGFTGTLDETNPCGSGAASPFESVLQNQRHPALFDFLGIPAHFDKTEC